MKESRMFGVFLRRRAAFWRAPHGLVGIGISCLLSACAASSGATYAGAASPGAPRELALTAEHRARSVAIRGPALDRAQFVRAVLEQNPSLESGRQAVRAAAARGRQA